MNNYLKFFKTTVVLSGGNVKHNTGNGPIMSLIGFIHPLAISIYEQLGENLTGHQSKFLAEKIIIDKDKGIGFYPSLASSTFYGSIWLDSDKLSKWYLPNSYEKSFKCLCRFYSDKEEKFIYKVFSPLELNFIDN